MNVPNQLTLARLLALPLIIGLFRVGHGVAAAGVLLAAMLTDCVDGWVARRFGQVSRLGMYLDPVVDKIFVIGLFYEVAVAGVIPLAIPHLLMAREFLQSAVRTVGAMNGTVIGANWMGKTKAVIQTPVLMAAMLTRSSAVFCRDGLVRETAWLGSWFVLAVTWVFFGVFLYWNRNVLLDRAAGAGRTG